MTPGCHDVDTMTTLSDTISIRLATPDDAVALARLAALDSAAVTSGPILLGERVIVFGRGSVERVLPELGSGYVLLTGARGAAAAPPLSANAATVVEVAPGRVDELAAALRPAVRGELLVAVGGGRVIDTAKAL